MAKYQVTVGFRDEGADSSKMQFFIDAADQAAADARASAIALLLDDLSGAVIDYLAVSHIIPVNTVVGLKASPDAGIDVERGQRLVFDTAIPGVKPFVTIPGIRILYDFGAGEVRVVDSNGQLNDSLTQWDDLFTEIFVTGDYEDYRGADLTALLKNYKVFRGKPELR